MTDFRKWGKTPRVNNAKVVITEKLDGTNASIYRDGDILMAGSRNRWIYPGRKTDNHGFAGWVADNRAALLTILGEGWTYGEWIGKGIARNYGLDHREWRIFSRYVDAEGVDNVHMVPLLCETTLEVMVDIIDCVSEVLINKGSNINEFHRPEGVVATIGNRPYKYIIDK